jgi:hypothetical protein
MFATVLVRCCVSAAIWRQVPVQQIDGGGSGLIWALALDERSTNPQTLVRQARRLQKVHRQADR